MLDFLFKKRETSARGDGDAISLDVIDPREVNSHCLISGNLHIRGDVYFSGTLRIDGRIDGKVTNYDGGKGHLVLSKGAIINGPVTVTSALVDGTITGPLDVMDKLECRTNAVLKGEVVYGKMHIADGAQVEARCRQREQRWERGSVASSGEGQTSFSSANFLATKKKRG